MEALAAHDDHALGRVPRSARRHWFGIAVQRFGQVSALSQFLLGATLGFSMTFRDAAIAFLLGSIVLEIVICVVGIIGQREGLQTSLLARWTGFGEVGSSIVGVAIAISLIGWFGIQSAISAESLESLMPGVLPVWAWSVIFGLLVTAIVAFGFMGMQWLANVTVPLFLLLVGWSITTELRQHSLVDLMTQAPPGPPMSIAAGTGLVAGGFIVGAIITADMTRFNRSAPDVIKQTVVGITLGEFVIGMSGVLLAHAAGTGNIVAIVTSSVGFVGLLVIVTGTLKINDWNLYSSVLGLVNFVSTVFDRALPRAATTVVIGIVGTLLAAFGILGGFVPFLVALSAAFPPIAGIMVAEYFVVKRFRPQLDATRAGEALPATAPRVVPATLVIWAASSLIGYFVTWGIPSITALVLAFVLYVVAGKAGLVRGVGEVRTDNDQPVAGAQRPVVARQGDVTAPAADL
ncbi:purine-cytosine permease family protein [Mobilicoccus caccae]|uniref:Cytosine permease n=1 Tax=Mobilicoccus caccae TaxID=1859295 RepID=A0ABQ6IMN9_9MICO|nr:cytosine permease [Mobilicoccus caccae]GMA39174.1 cytosine permease [Mobilicoccus caccae]